MCTKLINFSSTCRDFPLNLVEGSSTPSGRTFSVAGLTLNRLRLALSPEHVDMLVYSYACQQRSFRITFSVVIHAETSVFFQIQTFDRQTAFNNVYFCRFRNSENAPIHLLFSNLAWGLALD